MVRAGLRVCDDKNILYKTKERYCSQGLSLDNLGRFLLLPLIAINMIRVGITDKIRIGQGFERL
jgi:hypothetical protein